MAEKVFLDGNLVDAEEAKITVFDSGLQHGVGLFETLRSYRGSVFRLGDHLSRMESSARELGMIFDKDEALYRRTIEELLAVNELTDGRIRITVTAGSVRVGIHAGAQASPTILITCGALPPPPTEIYENGVGVFLSNYKLSHSDPIARHKTTSFLPRLLALKSAQHANLADALWLTDQGFLADGSTSNFFMVQDDMLLTPSLDLPIMPGVTRQVVLDIATDLKIPVQEGHYSFEQVLSAPEMFMTNTVIEIVPVVAIEKHMVGQGQVGQMTKTLLHHYQQKVGKELNLS